MSQARANALKEAHHLLHVHNDGEEAVGTPSSRRWSKLRMAVQVTSAFKSASRERLLREEKEKAILLEEATHPGNLMLSVERLKDQPVKTAMIVAIPLGVISAKLNWNAAIVFWLNFFALIPLSSFLGAATEDISSYTSEVLAGLINATFGNVVEMMVAVMALIRNDIDVVQAALLGSMLSNLLFVLGSCFMYGGYQIRELKFSSKAASTCTSLLLLATIALVLPTAMYHILPQYGHDTDELILPVSRATSVVIFIIYLQFLYFQLVSHKDYFEEDDEEDECEEHKWSMPFALCVLGITSVMTAYTSDFLVASIGDYSKGMGLNKDFISLILVASVGNIPEFYVTMMVAQKNKLDLALTIAVGSSCQMALLVTPFAVLTGWLIGAEMTLNFHMLEMISLLLAILTVSSVIQGGSATWLHGSLLVGSYVIIGMMFFFLPTEAKVDLLEL